MSQVSPPIRILLVGAVVFLAAWFTVLKPKPVEPVAPAPAAGGAPASKAGKFAAKAKAGAAKAEAGAVGAANAGIEDVGASPSAPAASAPAPSAAAPTQAGTATQAAPSAAPALPALPPESLEGLPKPLRTGLQERKIVVLGVLNTETSSITQMADDDRAVRRVLRDVNRYGGAVVVRTAPIARLAKYDGLLKALQVTQSPTVVVVDRNRRAVALEGYVDRGTVNQAIADARDTSVERRIKDPYLREVNEFCGSRSVLSSRASIHPTVRGGERRMLATHLAKAKRSRAAFARLQAPARWRSLDRRLLSVLATDVRLSAATSAAARRGGFGAAVRADRRRIAELATLVAPLDRRLNAVGLTACAAKRTR